MHRLSTDVAALIGVALMLVTTVIDIAAAGRPIGVTGVICGMALLMTLVGFVLYGAATLQAKVLPRRGGVALIIVLPVSLVFGEYGGNLLFGLMWLALDYVLWSQRGATDQRPSQVS